MSETKHSIWYNSLVGAIGTALVAVLGWLCLKVSEHTAELQSAKTERDVREDVTDVLGDVDRRLAIIETHMDWMRSRAAGIQPQGPYRLDDSPLMMPSAPEVEEPAMDKIRQYDLRSKK